MAEKQEFQFVNSTLDAPAMAQDKAVRVLIRKQAMKKASAAMKRDANFGKNNIRQYPVFIDPGSGFTEPLRQRTQGFETERDARGYKISGRTAQSSSAEGRVRLRQAKRDRRTSMVDTQPWLHNYIVKQGLVSPLSPTDYEAMSIDYGFDLLELSTLATMHVGRATRHAISADPYHLVLQMRSQKQWSYLSFLPGRYGQNPCLKEAAECCVARAQQIISPRVNGEAKVIARYLKALDSLQKAIDSPKQRYSPDVLCATEILAMYELLDPAGEVAWVRHASGAGRLIQLRGPDRYDTEFEKALLMAHIGPLMTEALILNERTFLEQDVWKAVLRSMISGEENSVADRSEIVISLHILKSNIPGAFKDVTTITCGVEEADPLFIADRRTFLHSLQKDLLDWRRRYEDILRRIPNIRMETMEYDRQCKVFATYLSCQMITNRLLSALVLYPPRRRLEAENQLLAKEMLHMESRARERKSSALLFMAQTAGVAGSIKASSDIWLEGDGENGCGRGELLEAYKLRAWCAIIGRKCM